MRQNPSRYDLLKASRSKRQRLNLSRTASGSTLLRSMAMRNGCAILWLSRSPPTVFAGGWIKSII